MMDEKTENDILLGRSENQAIELLKSTTDGITFVGIKDLIMKDEFSQCYIAIVKRFYDLNKQLAKEIHVPKVQGKPTEQKKKQWVKCPKCGDEMHPDWPEHKKCGWKR